MLTRKIKRNILRKAVGNKNMKKAWNSFRNASHERWTQNQHQIFIQSHNNSGFFFR